MMLLSGVYFLLPHPHTAASEPIRQAVSMPGLAFYLQHSGKITQNLDNEYLWKWN